jgi:FMN phosphatase YigB (HAD superfamily)
VWDLIVIGSGNIRQGLSGFQEDYLMIVDTEVIFFDLGDTLVRTKLILLQNICEMIGRIRSHPLEVNEYMLAFQKEWSNRRNQNAENAIKDVITPAQEINYWQDFFRSLLRRLGLLVDHNFLIDGLAGIYSNPRSFECFEDVHPVLADLKSRGYTLGLISNAFPSAVKIIEDLNLKDYFDYAILSFELPDKYVKPEPEIYKFAIEQVNIEITKTLFVDDRWPFVKAAQEVGMNAYLIERFTDQNQILVTKSLVTKIYSLYELRDQILEQTKPLNHNGVFSSVKKRDRNNSNPRKNMPVKPLPILG